MNRPRILRLLAAALVPLGLVLAGLGVLDTDTVSVVFGVLTTVAGADLYWMVGRYGVPFERFTDAEVDFTTTQTFTLGLVQAGIAVVQFGLLMLAAILLGVVTDAAVNAEPQSVFLAFGGVVPAVLLGAGLPYLIQRFDAVKRLNDTQGARVLGPVLTFGTYLLLVVYHPVAGVIYAIAYVGSRVAILLGFYVGARVQAAIT